MHLRWKHGNMKTQEYVEKYGEFRPKQIKEIQREKKSNIECRVCGKQMKSNQHLMYHITKDHKNITKEEYIIKYFYDNSPPLCKCGCGQKVKILPHGKTETGKSQYHTDYIKGHWDWVKPGYNYHTKETKEKMRQSAIARLEKEKGLFKGVSTLEHEFNEFIKTIYSEDIEFNNRTILSGLELDVFFPKLNLAIEFNGTYYHSDLFKNKNYPRM